MTSKVLLICIGTLKDLLTCLNKKWLHFVNYVMYYRKAKAPKVLPVCYKIIE